jgi:hypothetical protein
MFKNILYHIIVYIILVGLLSNCSFKNEKKMQNSFNKHLISQKKLQKSEKIQISKDGEIKIALTATYLNGYKSLTDKDEKLREKFIIGVYKSSDIYTIGFKSAEENLTLHVQYPKTDKELSRDEEIIRRTGYDALPIIVIEIASNSSLLQNIPLVNSWSKYYYVEFPHTYDKQFSLVFQNNQIALGQKYSLIFAKNKKYLYFTPEQKKEYQLIR